MRFFLLFLVLSFPALAVMHPDERLQDPVLEEKAVSIFKQVKCPSCAGQSIHNSEAQTALIMRQVIRERVLEGDDEADIYAYLQQEYGDQALMTPPLKTGTALLWLGPFLVLIFGGLLAFLSFRKAHQ